MQFHARHLALLCATTIAWGCSNADSSASTLALEAQSQSALSSGGAISPLAASGYCLDIGGNSSSNGTRVQLYACNGSDAQQWRFDNGLIRASNNRCLNVIDGNQANNVRLQIWACDVNDKNMVFTIQGNTIRWPVNNKCLDVVEGQFANGTPVQLYDCFDNSPNQGFSTSALGGATAAANTPAPVPSSSGGMLDGFVANAYQIPWNKWTPQNQTQGLVNNEQEAYVTDGSTISDDGGTLTITAYSNNNGYGWKSGKLLAPPLGTSRGYIEASMNTPSAQGTWPAFWLMPNENNPVWPQGGEIDIMEQINGQAVQNVSTHFGPNPSQVTSTHMTMNLPNMSGQYHRYGMAWDTSHCAFYVDGVQVPGSVRWFPQNSPFAQYLPNYTPILNLAIGGDWPGYAADGIGNQVLKVRYVAQSTQTPSDF